MRRLLYAVTAFLLSAGAVQAQGVPDSATVVPVCGAIPTTYSSGQIRSMLQNTDGQLCVDITLGGSLAVTQSGVWNITDISGTVSLPTGAATSALQGAVIGTKAPGTAAASSLLTGGVYNSGGVTLTDAQQSAFQLTSAGALITTGSISGTVAATQSGTWNLNDISGTISLPTGASTAANQSAVIGTKAPGTAAASALLTGGVYNSGGVTLTDGQQAALQFTSAGELMVTGGGGGGGDVNLIEIAGTAVSAGNGASGAGTLRVTLANDSTGVVNAIQSGTWNLTNISGTISLPTGASTAANQTSVIGTKAPGTAAASSLLGGGVYNSAGVTLTDGQQAAFQFTSDGKLEVNASVSAGDSNVTELGGNAINLGNGTVGTGTQRVTIASDSTGVIGATQSGAWTVTANAGTNLNTSTLLTTSAFNTVLGSASLILATQADDLANTSDGLQSTSFGYVFDGTTWDRLRGDSTNGALVNLGANNDVSINAGTNTIGRVNLSASATGGCTPGKVLSAASTNATSIKGSAGTLCKLTVINTTATVYYLKFYNTSSAPTCNSSTVVATYPVPASTTGAGVSVDLGPFGEAYSTGIGLCLTGALADNDNTNAATGVVISYSYI